jgi:hypothetical protein
MPRAGSATRKKPSRRPNGTGSLLIRRDVYGRDIWYGKWRAGDEQVKRRIGPKRGFTRTQAEAQLRGLMGTVVLRHNSTGRVTVAEAGQLMLERLEVKGRRRTTLATYESHIRVHLVPFFGSQRLDRIGRREIEAFIRFMARNGSSVKTTLNATGVLHSIFELARREGWVLANPCTLVDKPQAPPTDADIHFLEPEEIEGSCAPFPTMTWAASRARCISWPR